MKTQKHRRNARFLIVLIMVLAGCLAFYFWNSSNQDEVSPSLDTSQPIIKGEKHSLGITGPKPLPLPDEPLVDAPIVEGHSAILIDASSGKSLVKQDADIVFPVASMSKIMTTYIVLEQIEKARINWEDQVVISESANDIIPEASRIWVATETVLSVRDLFNAMVLSSANNATIALAEHITGTEKEFTQLMNDKAEQMGLSDKTYFVNSTGLPSLDGAENQMTAEDVAQLAYQLLRDFPEVLESTSLPEYELAFDGTVLLNSNAMLFPENEELYNEQVDGLKTGFTNAAGYCFTGTAKQGDKRLISVVMGTESEAARFLETYKLLAFGFEHY